MRKRRPIRFFRRTLEDSEDYRALCAIADIAGRSEKQGDALLTILLSHAYPYRYSPGDGGDPQDN